MVQGGVNATNVPRAEQNFRVIGELIGRRRIDGSSPLPEPSAGTLLVHVWHDTR
jgi:hypothetical protein